MKQPITISTAVGIAAVIGAIITPVAIFYQVTGNLGDRQTKTETQITNMQEQLTATAIDAKSAATDAKTAVDGVNILVKVITGRTLVPSASTSNYQALNQ